MYYTTSLQITVWGSGCAITVSSVLSFCKGEAKKKMEELI